MGRQIFILSPIQPIDRTELIDAMLRTELTDPTLSADVAEPILINESKENADMKLAQAINERIDSIVRQDILLHNTKRLTTFLGPAKTLLSPSET